MSLRDTIKATCEVASEDIRLRKELESGQTKTLYELKEGKWIDQLKWPEQWWLETWLRKRFKVGILGGSLYLFVILSLLPRALLTIYVVLLLNYPIAISYARMTMLGLIGDLPFIVVPLVSLRSLFEKLKYIVHDINYSVAGKLISAPVFARYIKHSDLQNINEIFLERYFKRNATILMQPGLNLIYSKKYQAISFLIAAILSAVGMWLTKLPYWGPAELATFDLLFFRGVLFDFMWGVVGIFSWSIAVGYLGFLALTWTINVVNIPRYRPLSIHYGQLSDLFLSMFSYVGLVLGFGSVWAFLWVSVSPTTESKSWSLYFAAYVSIIAIAALATIIMHGSYEMHNAMVNSKRRKLQALELELDKEKDLERYRTLLEEYRAMARDGTWPIKGSTFVRIIMVGIFSVIGSILSAIVPRLIP